MQFAEELAGVLPLDVPNRALLIEKSAGHLEMLVSANEYMNLTRILDPKEAAIKHVFDCVAPWRHFQHSRRVLDAGTGAGFPGIPLAVILPDVRFTLTESIGKKARFVDSVVETLHLPNVHVTNERAETIANAQKPDTITARAVAPMERMLDLFGKTVRKGARLLLFKGPDVEQELAEARGRRFEADVLCRYDLPEAFGTRSLLEIRASAVGHESLRKRATAIRE